MTISFLSMILSAVVLNSPGPTNAQSPSTIRFQGFKVLKDVGCSNQQGTVANYTWFVKDADISKRRDAARGEMKSQYPGALVLDYYWDFNISKPPVIALVNVSVECNAKTGNKKINATDYKFFFGPSKEEVTKRIESDLKGLVDVVGWSIQWIDVRAEVDEFRKGLRKTKYTTMGVRG